MANDSQRILIVEDDADTAQSLSDVLSDEGIQSDIVVNGRKALEYLTGGQNLPFLILLDLSMPDLDAYGFRQIQEMDASISSIPIVVVSAETQIQAKALKLGIRHSLKKPVDAHELVALVKKHMPPAPAS